MSTGAPLVLVVLRNGGGRIFEQLPIGTRDDLAFAMPHMVTETSGSLADVARALGLRAARVEIAVGKIAGRLPDVILSDWNMPEMNGIEFLQALRAAGNQVPFGFVTSEGSDAMRSQASESGALFLIAKPFTADMFAEALKPVLG